MRNKKSYIVKQGINYLYLILFITIVSCSSKGESSVKKTAEVLPIEENAYHLTELQFQSSGMELGKLENRDFHQIVNATGMLEVPPQNQISVIAYFGGYVKDIELLPGQWVNKGKLLFVLENPNFVEVQQDYLETQGTLTYLESDYERQKNLAKDNINSQKIFLKAESEYLVAKARFESLRKKLSLMGINPNDLSVSNIITTVPIYAPSSGYVTSININKGVYLNPSDVAVTIVNTNHIHLELAIFENDLSKVAVGQKIKFKLQNSNSESYDATVHLINKSVDPVKRTIQIHGDLGGEKASNKFTQGMYVEAEIYTVSAAHLSLPEDAIVEVENKYFVLSKNSDSGNALRF
ncbi:MAG: efflux RND transporter periplasmic adaptor subunit [Chitinophagales bacterium]